MTLSETVIGMHESLGSLTAKELGKFATNIQKTSSTFNGIMKNGASAIYAIAKKEGKIDDDVKSFNKIEVKGIAVESDGSIIVTFKAFIGRREFIELQIGIDALTKF